MDTSNGIPNGWVHAELSEFCDVVLGQSPPSSTYNEAGKGLPFFQGKAEFGAVHPAAEKWCTLPKKVAEKDSVLVSVRAPVGPTNICQEQCCIGRGLAAIHGLQEIPSLFILYLIRANENKLGEQGTGTTFNSISGDVLKGLPVLLPPLPEQQRIVSKIEELFTKLDAGVQELQHAQMKLKRYRQSVLKAAVTGELTREWRETHEGELEPASELLARILKERRAKWEVDQRAKMRVEGKRPRNDDRRKKYREPQAADMRELPEAPKDWTWATTDALFTFVTSGSRGWARYYSDSGSLFIRMGNLDHNSITLDLSDLQHVRPPKGIEGLRTRVERDDILVSITADVGMIAVVPDNLGVSYINQHVALARPVSLVNEKYLAWYLASDDGGQRQFKLMQRGATKTGLGLDDIRSVNVPFPPLMEQHQVVDEVERLLSIAAAMEQTIEQSLTQAERMRQSILKQAFEGKLVPQDPSDEPAELLLERVKVERAKREAEKSATLKPNRGRVRKKQNKRIQGVAA